MWSVKSPVGLDLRCSAILRWRQVATELPELRHQDILTDQKGHSVYPVGTARRKMEWDPPQLLVDRHSKGHDQVQVQCGVDQSPRPAALSLSLLFKTMPHSTLRLFTSSFLNIKQSHFFLARENAKPTPTRRIGQTAVNLCGEPERENADSCKFSNFFLLLEYT